MESSSPALPVAIDAFPSRMRGRAALRPAVGRFAPEVACGAAVDATVPCGDHFPTGQIT
jgi:hypothetical protein